MNPIIDKAKAMYNNGKYQDVINILKELIKSKSENIDDNISACYYIALCYKKKNDYINRLEYLLNSFK